MNNTGGTTGEFPILLQLFDKGEPEYEAPVSIFSVSATDPLDPRLPTTIVHSVGQSMRNILFDGQNNPDFVNADWIRNFKTDLNTAIQRILRDPTDADAFTIVDSNDNVDFSQFFFSATSYTPIVLEGSLPRVANAAPIALVAGTGEAPRRRRGARRTRRQKNLRRLRA